MEDPHLTSIRKFVSYHIYAGGYEGKCKKNIAFIIAKASSTYLLSIENCVVECKTRLRNWRSWNSNSGEVKTQRKNSVSSKKHSKTHAKRHQKLMQKSWQFLQSCWCLCAKNEFLVSNQYHLLYVGTFPIFGWISKADHMSKLKNIFKFMVHLTKRGPISMPGVLRSGINRY